MIKLVGAFLALCLALLTLHPVQGGSPAKVLSKKETGHLVATHLRWIEGRTPYSSYGKAPRIMFESKRQMGERYARALGMAETPESIHGLHEAGAIILPTDFDPVRDAYVLVHELVHFLQYINGATFACAAAIEAEAYALQFEFIMENVSEEERDSINIMYVVLQKYRTCESR